MVPVDAGCTTVTQTDSYALERVKIVDPQQISLISSLIVHPPHRTERPVTAPPSGSDSLFLFIGRQGWSPVGTRRRSVISNHLVPLQTWSTVRGAFILKIPIVSISYPNANLNEKSVLHYPYVCLSCKRAHLLFRKAFMSWTESLIRLLLLLVYRCTPCMLPVLSSKLLLIVVVSSTEKVTCTLAVALTRRRNTLLFPQTDNATPALKHRSSLRILLWVVMLFDRLSDPRKCRLRLKQSALDFYLLSLLLFFWSKVKAGTTPAAVSFPKVQQEQTKWWRVST